MALNPSNMELELKLDEDEAIYTERGIPAYSREFDTGVNFDDCPHISRLRDNPNLAVQLGVNINSEYSALPQLRAKRFDPKTSSQDLRREQTRRFAMTHVVRGAELTRENKCFEAIQCFNKAINIDEQCADAYVGRGAASAGLRNFSASLQDLEKAIELHPEHRNAKKYQLEVLLAFAKDLEKSGNLKEAKEKFSKVLEIQPGHSQALEFLLKINTFSDNNRKRHFDIIEIDKDDEEEKNEKINGFNNKQNNDDYQQKQISEEEAKKNSLKLKEMEEFIKKLKSGK